MASFPSHLTCRMVALNKLTHFRMRRNDKEFFPQKISKRKK